MTRPRELLRQLLDTPGCKVAAPIYDTVSARIAEMTGWEVCKMAGSIAKAGSYLVPDGIPLTNMSDLADTCRRITRVVDIPLIIDSDDGGGNPLTIRRTIRDLEAAGAAAIEIEDCIVPPHFSPKGRHVFMLSKEEHVAKLKAAVAIRQDPALVIAGRTNAPSEFSLDEAVDRIRDYSKTGVDAIMIPGIGGVGISPNPRTDIEAIQSVSKLPLILSGLPDDLLNDEKWLAANRVVIHCVGQAPYRNAVQAIYDALNYIKDGGNGDDLPGASPDIRSEMLRDSMLREWDKTYST